MKDEKFRRKVEYWMRRFPFVRWDRFVYLDDERGFGVAAYGWIDRKKDAYKDFYTPKSAV